jgi:hypothetical protein
MTKERDLEESERKDLWLKDLAEFIVEANMNTWAADAPEVVSQRPDHHELSYVRGDWELRDSYSGYYRAPGATVVYYKGRAAWAMMYFGSGMLRGKDHLANQTFNEALKPALMQVPKELPLRGPEKFEVNGWVYTFSLLRGDLEDFLAEEEITKEEDPIFRQTIGGGIIIHKDENRQPVYPWNL